ncbi:uncharacterized protein LOC108039883 [Drosophila rhopaloa]|uniref:Uncharacterized protein LOC108039883 n=1 Tax=Drosophila rhopaloa TaxID=1041015 RepID=A0A6P4E3H6_DRORH|nr:uncharacterized protein LOC108039883 [Drosophila rhopaloa]XP_016972532.1 uncharacterized protein LOC108039883 [Drosophila rhopaloa]XP_016972533.1 uncharacterized protein LOC108039883 [Drosophila rhopaloa]XP_016972534.1 uncharacterized protein LOC108039883 [Drosophila rhopaloa]XP_016972535.1 uncharacterized protein LOC108039883 [Drosophila rhopaloa]XP_016972536.1 uncharacterized protein LOC108039883 [Drosophila rhopaloa]XP_016972537.1 uncharacterized protein LOC108039883 [Drosophila rhopalo
MRPGPGLVVMALAFISGARRGSSSSISSATATPTAAAAVATSAAAATAAAAAAAAASSAAAAGATTSDGGGRGRGRGGGGGGVATTLPSTSESSSSSSSSFARSSGSYLLPIFLPHHLDFALQFHPQLPPREYSQYQAHSESWITSRIADRRQQRRRRRESSSSRDIAGRAGGTGLGLATGGGTAVTAGTEFGEANNNEETEEDRGLTVQFPSSQAYDEDQDIFALVAEDDLLSEESFDRLIKLNEDADEEDYNLQQQQQQLQRQQQPEAETEIDTEPESETETETETETEREAETETETETEQQQQDESRLIDEGVLQHNDNSNSHSKEFANSYDNNNNKREASGHILDAQTAQLIGHKDNSLSAVATTESAGAGAGAADSSTTTSLPAPVDLKKSILGTATSLTRLNPWISACDLAQPGTATDLQGQCSAGTLPMAWVDEGPGPPICPRSCAEQQQQRPAASKAKRSATSNNKVKYFVNYKTAQMRLRRGGEYAMDATESNSPAASERPTSTTDDQEDVESSFSFSTTTEEAMAEADTKVPEPTLSYSHLHAQEPILVHQQGQEQGQGQWQEEQEEQQQCLEYLGDSAESSPQHLCDLQSPAHLLERLRVLRLRNCCERSAFSALHTLALNASLSDRSECIRVLTDLLDVDGLANRITCELAEILFRFDCRQVYSLINQCDDCKEAYRRWVCSTLVPYFAEPKDVSPKPKDDGQANTGKSKRSARSAAMAMAMADHRVDGIKHKSLKLISNNNKSNNGNNMNERQINQKHDKSSNANANANASANKDIDRSVEEAIGRDLAQTFYDVVGLSKPRHGGEQVLPDDEPAPDADSEVETDTDRERERDGERDSERDKEMDRERDRETEKGKETETDTEAEAEQQSNNFISTANNSDPRATDPVISKLQKRSTRKTEFRKRRRIRPCLSVCQTVEQKCPYLLPADRAPALPTQYAGEPTFLCLDQNIPETGAQLEKSSYGPNDCCYSYCNGPASGICTICPDFSQSRMEEQEGAGPGNSTRRVHNITISLSSHPGEHARAKSVALALRNVSQTNSDPDAVETLLERLPYYARHDGVFYYDEEGEMPQASLSGDCAVVPTVTTRCTIPYYASGTEAVARPPTQLLIWLSALLGLLSSCGAARQRWSCQWSSGCGGHRGRHAGHSVACEASCHEQELVKSRGSGPRTPAALPAKEKLEVSVPVPTRSWLWSRSWHTYKLTCSKVRFFSSRSKFKGESGASRLTNYKESRSLRAGIQWSWGAGCFRTRNYRYFYYYNYNINDWWRRWWRCLSSGAL